MNMSHLRTKNNALNCLDLRTMPHSKIYNRHKAWPQPSIEQTELSLYLFPKNLNIHSTSRSNYLTSTISESVYKTGVFATLEPPQYVPHCSLTQVKALKPIMEGVHTYITTFRCETETIWGKSIMVMLSSSSICGYRKKKFPISDCFYVSVNSTLMPSALPKDLEGSKTFKSH